MINKVKEERIRRKMTQEELAERAGITRQRLAAIESNHFNSLRTSTIVQLADALNCEVDEIFLL